MKLLVSKIFFCLLVLASFDALSNGESTSSLDHSNKINTFNNQSKIGLSWKLAQEDQLRYQAIMSGPRGNQSPSLDPISALGIEARNDAERRHYAELWVKQEYERTEKELKFQREVDAAWKRLMPNMLPVNMGNAAGIAHDSGGRLALFVRGANCQRCDARLSAVLADKRPVDIYLVDSEGSDQKLRNWAQQHRIPAEQVRERRITLNHDGGRWLRYGNGIMPVLLQQGESGWHIAAF
ncbi:TPA: TIGR03759 family integrating conjugative element protein [Klebsiella michiganensis]|nr:TIGR03759 family integrating conjugative element protein [Klebsiella michiganensis]ELS4625789.1 TIGR03759 family integrating conjugative element protein [Klebsiella michiganensis]HCQ8476898.1 TIGR03759 family integrating conjugative element protein [Klebsiella michiganensis]HCU0766853.1 TIGR03759 family integrating conjugative element protein [Klebsiella michiganensis]HEP0440765.1 TIGR03759 family integrating conjugative element protein [Klebsiella michiganensis]